MSKFSKKNKLNQMAIFIFFQNIKVKCIYFLIFTETFKFIKIWIICSLYSVISSIVSFLKNITSLSCSNLTGKLWFSMFEFCWFEVEHLTNDQYSEYRPKFRRNVLVWRKAYVRYFRDDIKVLDIK